MSALTDLADDYYAFASTASPLDLMWSGKLDALERWDDFSPTAVAQLQAKFMKFAAAAEALEVGSDPSAVALRDSIATGARSRALDLTWSVELFQVNPKMGMLETILSFVDNFRLTTAADGAKYLAKMHGMADALAQMTHVATAAAAAGRVALTRHLNATADSVDAYLSTEPGSGERLCAQAAPTHVSDKEAAAWRAERDAIILDEVRPGLAHVGKELRALAAMGQPDDKPGLCHLPGGNEVYKEKIWANLLTDHTAEQIHAIGVAKIAELEDEYRALAGPLFDTTDIATIYATLRDDESLKYADAAAIVADAESALARANAAAPDWFAHLPQSSCTAHATNFGAMAYYSAPDPATGKQGDFYFNTSTPSAWSTYELEAITYHEAIPGHHLQLALHAENPDLHIVQREFFNTAYAEGWGLYTERLADEMGLYSSDIARLGMLNADSLRACRLVVDTGMHAMGWSREHAIEYMIDHSPIDRAHIEAEVDRYIGMPGQALAYMIGRMEILSVRAEAEARPGFDIKEFHDAVLRYGAVPLPTLRAIVLGAKR
jgi:uncharacterized protein (DUF885 family)